MTVIKRVLIVSDIYYARRDSIFKSIYTPCIRDCSIQADCNKTKVILLNPDGSNRGYCCSDYCVPLDEFIES